MTVREADRMTGWYHRMQRYTAGVLLLSGVLLSLPGRGQPTTALPPSPDAFTFVTVKYPPVPLAGTEWARTVKKRDAERQRAKKSARGAMRSGPHNAVKAGATSLQGQAKQTKQTQPRGQRHVSTKD